MKRNLAQRLILGAATAFTLTGSLAAAQPQYGYGYGYAPPPPPRQQWDDAHWGAGPQGYGEYYREEGRPNFGARRGYSIGFDMGISDRRTGHSFRPTHLDEYKHVPDAPPGMPRDEFKHFYREAFVRGYQRGYGA